MVDGSERHNRRTFIKTAGGGTVLTLGLAGCSRQQGGNGDGSPTGGPTPTTRSEAPERIKIGLTNALSGRNADVANLYTRGYEMAVDDINNGSDRSPFSWEGGGIHLSEFDQRVEIDLLMRDSQSSQDRAVNQYRQLIQQEDIHAALGPYSSGVTQAVGSVLEENGVPWIADAAGNPQIFQQGWNWIFGLETPVNLWLKPRVDWLDSLENPPEFVAVYHESSSVSQVATSGMMAHARENTDLNIEVLDTFPPDATDLSSSIQRGINRGAEAFLGLGHLATDMLFARQVYELGANPKALGVGLSHVAPAFIENLQDRAIGVHGTQVWHNSLDYPGVDEFTNRYREAHDSVPDYHVQLGFDAVNILGKAIERAGSLNKSAISDTLASTTFENTLRGPVDFADDTHLVQGSGTLTVQVQGSAATPNYEVIAPPAVASGDPMYPLN